MKLRFPIAKLSFQKSTSFSAMAVNNGGPKVDKFLLELVNRRIAVTIFVDNSCRVQGYFGSATKSCYCVWQKVNVLHKTNRAAPS